MPVVSWVLLISQAQHLVVADQRDISVSLLSAHVVAVDVVVPARQALQLAEVVRVYICTASASEEVEVRLSSDCVDVFSSV